jgi:hypothetical protein
MSADFIKQQQRRAYYLENKIRIQDKCRNYARKQENPKYTCPVQFCTPYKIACKYKAKHEETTRHQVALARNTDSVANQFCHELPEDYQFEDVEPVIDSIVIE